MPLLLLAMMLLTDGIPRSRMAEKVCPNAESCVNTPPHISIPIRDKPKNHTRASHHFQNARIAENATDFEKVAKLDAELRELVAERDALEMRWLELAENA